MDHKLLFRMILSRVLKATAKSLIVIIVFLILSQMLQPLNQIFPQANALIETYVMVYVVFIVLNELTKGTIYQYALGMGRAFFFMGYTIYALNSGIITQTIEPVTFTVNLEIFLMMIILIGTLDFAKSLIQIINHMATKAETEEIIVPTLEQEIPAQ
ncbi:MAG TPA: hypothetical protein VMS95_03335 [Candidatus Krumholzibacteriaceae bacterium]|nr:hypothetical protein [Candidatus Krumholzibacteriaceae bacterium]